MTSPYEQLGRERKAFAFALALRVWNMIPREERTRIDLGQRMAACSQEERDVVAFLAGKREPSQATWKRVCEMIDEKAAEERRFLGQLDDSRAAS